MDHLAFYNVGSQPSPGGSGLKVWLRRLFRRIMLPASQRLVEILASLCRRLDVGELEIRDLKASVDDLRRRQEEQAGKLPATIAFGWDYVALVRRLAVLEEHVDTLLAARGVTPADLDADADADLDPDRGAEIKPDPAKARAKLR